MKEMLTTSEAAEMLGLSERSVQDRALAGELPAINLGRGPRPLWRFRRADILAFLESRRVPAAAGR